MTTPSTMDTLTRQIGDGRAVTLFPASGANAIPSGAQQAAIARGSAAGSIATFGSTQSPTSILTITTTEKAMTVIGTTALWKIAANDLLFINKPTSQAGLGMGNVRVSASNSAGVTFSNFTASTITPTASEVYSIIAIRGFGILSPVLTPPLCWRIASLSSSLL